MVAVPTAPPDWTSGLVKLRRHAPYQATGFALLHSSCHHCAVTVTVTVTVSTLSLKNKIQSMVFREIRQPKSTHASHDQR